MSSGTAQNCSKSAPYFVYPENFCCDSSFEPLSNSSIKERIFAPSNEIIYAMAWQPSRKLTGSCTGSFLLAFSLMTCCRLAKCACLNTFFLKRMFWLPITMLPGEISLEGLIVTSSALSRAHFRPFLRTGACSMLTVSCMTSSFSERVTLVRNPLSTALPCVLFLCCLFVSASRAPDSTVPVNQTILRASCLRD